MEDLLVGDKVMIIEGTEFYSQAPGEIGIVHERRELDGWVKVEFPSETNSYRIKELQLVKKASLKDRLPFGTVINVDYDDFIVVPSEEEIKDVLRYGNKLENKVYRESVINKLGISLIKTVDPEEAILKGEKISVTAFILEGSREVRYKIEGIKNETLDRLVVLRGISVFRSINLEDIKFK